ncbi:hypothetical protein [Methanolobus chelungpuianus]|uniref:Uncharacterized protein n=1 Tax=Methanolobus chelungpuianus TaxID=502115 RepID=A0AAE3HB31_9EURY|nr:hypothetical protein [Methanolobus chelungpuianus]MCQ6962503.1 hypothetical protein [Methanolobus chelungpuianus]
MMKKRTIMAFCILMILFLAAGCIDDLVPVDQQASTGNISSYEFEAFTNHSFIDGDFLPTATFYLSREGHANVVYMVQNESVIDIIPLEDLSSSNEEPVTDIVVIASSAGGVNASARMFEELSASSEATPVNYTLSEDVVRGQKHVYLTFSEPVTGFVAFTMSIPRGQDFLHVTTPPSVVRFVIPEGYTTGNSLIGKTTPAPDDIYYDSSGRRNLVWISPGTASGGILERLQSFSNNTDSQVEQIPRAISVKYYSESAPRGLLIATLVLGLAAFLVLSGYRRERKRLATIRQDVESRYSDRDRKKKQ